MTSPAVGSHAAGPHSPSFGAASPPHPLDAEWHMHANGQTYGPYTGHRLADFVSEGRFGPSTMVLPQAGESWLRADDDARLAPLFRSRPQSAGPPLIAAAPGATVVQVTNTVTPQPVLVLGDDGLTGTKSPGTALLLSFLLCGAGQMYCGRVGKGLLMLFGCILLWMAFLGWIVSIWSMIDAYSTAKMINDRFRRRLQGFAVI